MFRLSGAPAHKATPKANGPLFFTDNEKEVALHIAEELHGKGFKVRLTTYGDGKFRALFDSQARSRRARVARKLAA
jgi:hypothetical protein